MVHNSNNLGDLGVLVVQTVEIRALENTVVGRRSFAHCLLPLACLAPDAHGGLLFFHFVLQVET